MSEEFDDFFEEIKDEFIEGTFNSRWLEIETYHLVGEHIEALISTGLPKDLVVDTVSANVKRSCNKVKQYLDFFRKYPNLNETKFTKAVSWSKIARELTNTEPKQREKRFPTSEIKEILDKQYKKNASALLDERCEEDEELEKIIIGGEK